METFTLYEVGGCVRDEILEIKSKDIDYVVVPNDDSLKTITSVEVMFNTLVDELKQKGFEIFLITPSCFTIRAKFPKEHKHSGVADFVMARKEVGYVPNTRTPIVVPGTLYDDLIRRDFTLNALAKDENGNIIDFFNGVEHLKKGVLKTPKDCVETFNDDPLRILRAIRFVITKGFWYETKMDDTIQAYDFETKMNVVSHERIREELHKCFKHNTIKTLQIINDYPRLRNYIFKDNLLWLEPTMRKN